jgi:hypothetical protein
MNTCVINPIKQQYVNCSADEEFISKNTYVNSFMTFGYEDTDGLIYSEQYNNYKLEGAVLYGYEFGPCENRPDQYMNAIKIFKLSEETTFPEGTPKKDDQEWFRHSARVLETLITLELGKDGYTGNTDVNKYTPVEDTWFNGNGGGGFINGVTIEPTTSSDSDGMFRIHVDKWYENGSPVAKSTSQDRQRFRYRGWVIYNSRKYPNGLPEPDENESWVHYTNRLSSTKFCVFGSLYQTNVYPKDYEMYGN